MSDKFSQFVSGQNVPLYYLGQDRKSYMQNQSLNMAFNLYIAKLVEINSFSKTQLQGNLSLQTLTPQNSSKATYYEQSIFFIGQNGNGLLRQFAIDACDYFSQES